MNALLFSDVEFSSEDAWASFNLLHGVAHQAAYQKILALDITPTYLDLFVFPREENQTYLKDHWAVHQSNARALGINGLPDLSTVDLSDPEQYQDWMQLHYQVHQRENAVLGV